MNNNSVMVNLLTHKINVFYSRIKWVDKIYIFKI